MTSEEIEFFVEERQQLIHEINYLKKENPFSQTQVTRLKNILLADSIILGRMEFLKSEAANWLQNRGQAKMQRNAYEAVYSPDSIIMDRRK
ncbi:hypothetical protein [Paenibacillus rhizosphaerae]|nr:hypothetical protein [Paenibacillus rhizosphaerae]